VDVIDTLTTLVPAAPDRPNLAGPDHPIRKVTQSIAFRSDGWTPERAANVTQLFDKLAVDWAERASPERREPLLDALARGCFGSSMRLCAEVGSGTGSSTAELSRRVDSGVALDISHEMLRRAPAEPAARVRADAAKLPLPDRSASCVALVNAFLFPAEVDRVLAPGGTLVWVSSLGDRTPIYLTPSDVEKAMPGQWQGVAADAGWGSWCTLQRLGEQSSLSR
jgi:SAM-dependent methyltransferase